MSRNMDHAIKPIAVMNNIVTPYTNRLFALVSGAGKRIVVISSSAGEPNRNWGNVDVSGYEQKILRSWRLNLGRSRFAYLSPFVWSTLSRLAPRAVVLNGFYPTMVLGLLWAKIRKVPVALSIDGWAETMPASLYHRCVRPWVIASVKTVAVCSAKGRDYFLDAGVKGEDIHVVRLVPAWNATRTPASFFQRPFDIIWCAHLEVDTKGFDFFVEVVSALSTKIENLNILIIGTGSRLDLLEKLSHRNIKFTHYVSVPWNSMEDHFSAAKILMLSSRWEPWGLVCNEAMQCGTPCIVSTHVGAGGDLVTDRNGYVLDLDVSDWVGAAFNVLSDPDYWERLSNSAVSDVSSFSIERSVESYSRFLNSVAE